MFVVVATVVFLFAVVVVVDIVTAAVVGFDRSSP